MVTLTINGREIQAEEGTLLRTAAREHNIDIPGLCDEEAVAPYGACRLCMVEITTARGRQRLVASCLYPVEEGLQVVTENERLAGHRRVLLELLLTRCPDVEKIQEMAKAYGVTRPRFPVQEDNNRCILCALCTRVCREVVGVSAISLSNRGVERKMTTPFDEDASEACIGCGSCAFICPTDAIRMIDRDGRRTIRWPHNKLEFKMHQCKVCGSFWVPEKQIEYIAKISGTKLSDYDACPVCRE
ncbi:MAG: 2Fe-2S iron-sulfur cluster-binding protein [Chloroflexota bacterium]